MPREPRRPSRRRHGSDHAIAATARQRQRQPLTKGRPQKNTEEHGGGSLGWALVNLRFWFHNLSRVAANGGPRVALSAVSRSRAFRREHHVGLFADGTRLQVIKPLSRLKRPRAEEELDDVPFVRLEPVQLNRRH